MVDKLGNQCLRRRTGGRNPSARRPNRHRDLRRKKLRHKRLPFGRRDCRSSFLHVRRFALCVSKPYLQRLYFPARGRSRWRLRMRHNGWRPFNRRWKRSRTDHSTAAYTPRFGNPDCKRLTRIKRSGRRFDFFFPRRGKNNLPACGGKGSFGAAKRVTYRDRGYACRIFGNAGRGKSIVGYSCRLPTRDRH